MRGPFSTGKKLPKFTKLTELGDKSLNLTNAILLAVMVIAIFLQVIARYIFNHALPWPEELGRFLFAWIVFLGIVSVIRADEMLSLDILYRGLPQKIADILKLIISIIVFGFLLLLLKGSYELMIRQSSQLSVALEIPMWTVYFVIPFGTFLMAISILIKTIGQFIDLFAKREIIQEEKSP